MKHIIKASLLTMLFALSTFSAFAQSRVNASLLYSNIQSGGQIRPGATVQIGIAVYDSERVRLELIADAGYHFDTKRATDYQTIFGGFRVAYKASNRLSPFAHAMYGASKSKYINSNLRFTPYPASAFGGGLDVIVNDRFSIRAVQVDVINVDRLQPRRFVRYGSGIVVKLF